MLIGKVRLGTKSFVLKQILVLRIARKASWQGFEFIVFGERNVAQERGVGNDAVDVLGKVGHLGSQPLETLGVQTVDSSTKDGGAIGLNVKIIAREEAVFAIWGNENTEVTFVGAFVGRETNVSINAVDTLLDILLTEGWVERSHLLIKELGKREKCTSGLLIEGTVGIEPWLVVVGSQLVEEIKNNWVYLF